VKDKFILLVRDTFDPISFLSAAFNAGLDQASHRDPTFGQGAEGYGKRFGADFAGQTTWRFFTDFAYPTIFKEDPRYYRLIHGSGRRRFFHAVEHTFVAQRDSGKHMFNFSGWLGTATAVALNDVYHPGNERGLSPALRRGGYSLASGMGFGVLREFWPDIARKFHMPFRDTREQSATETGRSPLLSERRAGGRHCYNSWPEWRKDGIWMPEHVEVRSGRENLLRNRSGSDLLRIQVGGSRHAHDKRTSDPVKRDSLGGGLQEPRS